MIVLPHLCYLLRSLWPCEEGPVGVILTVQVREGSKGSVTSLPHPLAAVHAASIQNQRPHPSQIQTSSPACQPASLHLQEVLFLTWLGLPFPAQARPWMRFALVPLFGNFSACLGAGPRTQCLHLLIWREKPQDLSQGDRTGCGRQGAHTPGLFAA